MSLREWICVRQLAAELGMHRSSARRLARKFAALPVRRPVLDSKTGQRASYWTRDQVERIKAQRRNEGFEIP